MPDLTPDLAELRRLLDVNRERDFHALPWHAWDRGIGYELHVGATCRDKMEPRGYCEGVNNGFRETFCAPEAELIVAAVNALPALLDVAAERDELAAKVERVRAMHRPAYNDAARSPLCPDCAAKAGVHPCGCWADTDYEPVCAVCNEGHKGMSVPWPCETIRAICGAES